MRNPMIWALALACLLIAVLAPVLAFAADAAPAGALVIPWGTWVLELAHIASAILVPLAVTYLGLLLKRASPFLSAFFTNALIDRMVNLAVDFALASIEGAAKGRTVSVAVAPALVTLGAQRALDSTLPWIVARAGGVQGIAERVFRRLDLDPAASAENTLAPALDALAAGVPGQALVPPAPVPAA
ncbi:hypothetical protein [Methylobacterium sp. J-068]|uniref:hypothetical protein n=1 Tax=Methylobacterium sp. J-068 TaxID=2836649 RepID=UPI001FB86F72|nr:hypothetical protein [Methylobacterium sp. J-068]MCJ2037080.1 hypothetical protein [Methylobacterium sp. J-068]